MNYQELGTGSISDMRERMHFMQALRRGEQLQVDLRRCLEEKARELQLKIFEVTSTLFQREQRVDSSLDELLQRLEEHEWASAADHQTQHLQEILQNLKQIQETLQSTLEIGKENLQKRSLEKRELEESLKNYSVLVKNKSTLSPLQEECLGHFLKMGQSFCYLLSNPQMRV